MIRLCDIDEDEVQTILEDLENQSPDATLKLKNVYADFFRKCLAPDINMKVASFIESEWATRENKAEMLPPDLAAELDKQLGLTEVGSTTN